jgi:2-methylcitrate dehydratase PrpD
VRADDIAEIVCNVGEGTVHRLWEPLADKHRPPTPYAAKFSTPYCMAIGFLDRDAGLAQFTDARITDRAVLDLAGKIRYNVDPNDEYPRRFTGHLRATLKDGSQREFRQPYMRGGAHAPLSAAELEAKFLHNTQHGGWPAALAMQLRDVLRPSGGLFSRPNLDELAEFRA